MVAYLFLLVLELVTPRTMAHQQQERLSCATYPVDKNFGKKELWDGYKVSVGPTAHFEDDSGADDACTAAIYDPAGKEVYRTTGPSVRLDPATGMDIDGDGAPDVVLMNGASGTSGGGGGWQIEVVSLKPQLHLLFKFVVDLPPAPFEKDSQQRVVLLSGVTVDDFALAYEWPHAARSQAQRIYRFIDGKLVDVTPEHCSEVEAGPFFQKLHRKLTPQALERFKTSENLQDLQVDDMSTGARILSVILQHIFCHRFDQALDTIHHMWPPRDQANLIKNLKDVSKKWDCPECARQIEQWHSPFIR
jgi:hypothetical protein